MKKLLLILTIGFISFSTVKKTTICSWYGKQFHGKKTASGEIYNKWDMTAASPTLKFGTKIKITSLTDTTKFIVVRVNDRGPYKLNKLGKLVLPLQPHPTRAFDLSRGAFSKISNINKGIIKVTYEIIN